MPSILDDPTSPPIFRTSGAAPFTQQHGPLPADVVPCQVTLRDRITTATLVPFSSPQQAPPRLAAYLCELLNQEIDKGDTYPMTEPFALSVFVNYWFANFAAVMVVGDVKSREDVARMEKDGAVWSKQCLGSFYVKPNYPGRSSHVCNGGFLVTDAARGRGVGRLMGEMYLEWAPKLGYTYSVFNLVYETNVASLRIWDALGFKRIGRVKGCGNLKSYPDQYIDAIIFGRELGGEGDEYVSEERFDKIRFYLKTGTYPNGSDRAEKSRLRSAATHYRLVQDETGEGEEEKLMLKGKEVISDPHKQYEIARSMHSATHGGINKTTASIAERYHWVRIKETVSAAIRNCPECKDTAPRSTVTTTNVQSSANASTSASASAATPHSSRRTNDSKPATRGATSSFRILRNPAASMPLDPHGGLNPELIQDHAHQHQPHHLPTPPSSMTLHYPDTAAQYADVPVDPQIMQSMQEWSAAAVAAASASTGNGHNLHGHHPHHHQHNPGATAMDIDDKPSTHLSHSTMHDLMPRDPHSGGAAAADDDVDVDDDDDDDPVDARLRQELEAQILRDQAAA